VTLQNISDLLHAQVLAEGCDLNVDVQCAKASDLMSDVLVFAKPGSLLLTGLTNNQVVRTCEVAGICGIVFVRNKMPTPETIRLSREISLPIFLTECTMFEACGILYAHGIKGVSAQPQ
jgi:hypothetical protein